MRNADCLALSTMAPGRWACRAEMVCLSTMRSTWQMTRPWELCAAMACTGSDQGLEHTAGRSDED